MKALGIYNKNINPGYHPVAGLGWFFVFVYIIECSIIVFVLSLQEQNKDISVLYSTTERQQQVTLPLSLKANQLGAHPTEQ